MKFEQPKAFGKRTEMPQNEDAQIEARFNKLVEDFNNSISSGNPDLDEMLSDYSGLQAFNEVAGVMADAPEMEKQKALIFEHLRKQQS